ncbi:hypothetical protein BH09MYX1_BH09MYX1_00830 [soil metagenome]
MSARISVALPDRLAEPTKRAALVVRVQRHLDRMVGTGETDVRMGAITDVTITGYSSRAEYHAVLAHVEDAIGGRNAQ